MCPAWQLTGGIRRSHQQSTPEARAEAGIDVGRSPAACAIAAEGSRQRRTGLHRVRGGGRNTAGSSASAAAMMATTLEGPIHEEPHRNTAQEKISLLPVFVTCGNLFYVVLRVSP